MLEALVGRLDFCGVLLPEAMRWVRYKPRNPAAAELAGRRAVAPSRTSEGPPDGEAPVDAALRGAQC